MQAAVHTNLNGVGGLTGWQWLFIMYVLINLLHPRPRLRLRLTQHLVSKTQGWSHLSYVLNDHSSSVLILTALFCFVGITVPIAFAGLFLIPDIPNKPNPRARWWLRQKHLDIAQERMAQMKRAPPTGFSLQTFKKGFSSWVPWAFFVPYTCFVLG